MAFNDDGSSLISASDDRTARVWEVSSGRQEHLLLQPESVHAAFFLDSNGRTALTISSGGSAVWDVDSGKRLANLEAFPNVLSAEVSRAGQVFAMGSDSGNLMVWDFKGRLQTVLHTGHEVWSIAITSDKKFLATAPLREREATIWNLSTGKATLTFLHPANVSSVAFDPSGLYLASGAVDGSIRIWDVSERKSIAEYQGSTQSPVSGLRFTSDGLRLIIGFENGFTELIPWMPRESLDAACSRLHSEVFSRQFQDYVGAGFVEKACQ